MITVYVLLSSKDGAAYVGMAMNAVLRLGEHNSGKNRYMKGHMPWVIVYTEIHPNWTEARVREKFLKTTSGKLWLKKHLLDHGGVTGSLPA